MVMGSKED